jgi:tRNA A-37 threonylcarbamoyl transferase component Bud32
VSGAPPEESVQERGRGRRFRVLGTIGSGGFGTVYKAELLGEGGFRKVYALKVLNPEVEVHPEVAGRLRDEARILGLVRHRAIVGADSLLQVDGRWVVVMEFVEGVDLHDVLEHGALPLGPALEVAEEVAEALHQAHVQPGPDGVPLALLHRDIKPPNVQITAAGEVKVLDFGTARANFAKREARTTELAFGTLDYMSPERMEFEDSHAGDVYALGALLFEMLVGHPLGRTSPIARRHEGVVARAREALAAFPEGVVELVSRCLAFSATDRPTAAEFARVSRRLRAGQTEWLVEWAAARVPGWIAARGELATDAMTGRELAEASDGPASTTWLTRPAEAEAAPAPEPGAARPAPRVVTPSTPAAHGHRPAAPDPAPAPVSPPGSGTSPLAAVVGVLVFFGLIAVLSAAAVVLVLGVAAALGALAPG